MSYGHLLKTQANDVLNAITKKGLDPEDFDWDLEGPPTLRHTQSKEYLFTFEEGVFGQHGARYCPADYTTHVYRGAVSWEEQLSLVENWLTNLMREIQAPDLWSLLSEQIALVEAAAADSPNTPFSTAEMEKIADGLRELQAYIENTQHLDAQKHGYLNSMLGYLVDASQRQGRQDWLHTAIGVLFTIVVGLAMAPDQAKEIFRFVDNVLQAILKTPRLLP